jgi:serine phosphatase RsbU (regulator of sigma subunit)/PAS domain-containing protein
MSSPTPGWSSRRAHIGLALALALEVVLLVVDVLTHSVIFTTTYLAAPLALALVASARTVAATAVLSVGLAIASGGWNHYFASSDHLLRTTMVTVAGVLAVLSARARQTALAARAETEAAHRVADAARRRLDAMLGTLAEAVTVHNEAGKTIYANDAAVTLLGATDLDEILAARPGDLAGRFIITHEDGSPVRVDEFPGRRAVLGEPAEPMLTRSVEITTGRAFWLLTKATLVQDEDGRPLAVNIIEDLTAVKDSELRQRFLAEAGRALASSLNYEQTLERVAQLAVPELADWCAVDVLDDDGVVRRVALAHRDPTKIALAQSLQERYPPDRDADTGLGAVLRSGVGELYSEITDEMLEQAAVDEEHLEIMRSVGLRSGILAPMRIGERTIGAMSFVTADSGRALEADDLVFAEDLALRAAVAVENARLYTERARTAQTLQDSLLPRRLPDLPHYRTAVTYLSAEQGADVGGDFYDLFAVEGGAMVILGDVTGKGVQAAALTAMIRHSAKTAARFDPRPACVLSVVNDVLRGEPDFPLVTVVCARLHGEAPGAGAPDAGAIVDIASGGHPLPLRLDVDGSAHWVGRGGLVLGAMPDPTWPEERVALAPGETLLFYTDGATEAAGDGERFGEERLVHVAAGPTDPHAVVARIERALEDFQHGRAADDRALLAIQYVGADGPAPTPAGESRISTAA